MKHYILRPGGQEEEISLEELREAVTSEKLPGTVQVRREGQEYAYPAAQLLGLEACKPLLFMCPVCRKQVKSTVIDMQLSLPCPSCASMVTVPDRRPPAERQQAHRMKMSLSEANMRIAQGVFLCGATLGIYLLARVNSLGGWGLPGLLPIAMGGVGLFLAFTGLEARKRGRGRMTNDE